ncbi:citrate lyase acyl carrier protein [Paenibacillus macerans]|uniref:citrate lyase acyl carrier protein n=1 Tax=Paenibacillus TaxID=44249 RepID=UPI00097A0ABC|nr:citrate lyase acyl carrier protein [Paenibacillus macerans]MEC0138913.1 citrate lyase acyl carrier protein [Paenibacillus macerans]MED4955035.1 citrate lyase acyl carrier protein [Paenibacillus macerans]OMG50648.1 citrate lyase acyl carrier protein [Paenibacillus macerans]
MKIKQAAIAGTLESSDISIAVENNEGRGIEIELVSTVENQFGGQIRKVIRETLVGLGVKDVLVRANDKGALDCTIQARVKTAVGRAVAEDFRPWEEK